MSEQIAWAAGLFEGEGTIGYQCGEGDRIRLRFALGSTDRDVVDRFHEIVACGHITGPKWRTLSTKPIWLWTATSHDAAVHLTEILLPYLGTRRRDALERAWHEFATQPPPRHRHRDQTHCKRGHELTPANTRVETSGSRRCLTCERLRGMTRRWRQRGLDLGDIQLLLGHADIGTTQSIYVHEDTEDSRKRMAAIRETS